MEVRRSVDVNIGDEVVTLLTDAELGAGELVKQGEARMLRVAQIKAQLIDIDARSIRPMVEGDAAYLVILRESVAALRTELAGL